MMFLIGGYWFIDLRGFIVFVDMGFFLLCCFFLVIFWQVFDIEVEERLLGLSGMESGMESGMLGQIIGGMFDVRSSEEQ